MGMNLFTPSWMNQGGSGGGGGGGRQSGGPSPGISSRMPYGGRPSGGPYPYGGRASQEKPRKIIETPSSMMQDIKIHKAENAWKPAALKKTKEELDEEEKVTVELVKNFRGFLNKITPQKYEVILDKIRGLNIDTEDRLTKVLDLIFKKAVDEPAFCVQYANLCQHLATISVTKTNERTGELEQVKFQRLLLTKCQNEFEKDVYESIDVPGKQKEIDECTDDDQRKLLKAELDEAKRLCRKKSLGNIK